MADDDTMQATQSAPTGTSVALVAEHPVLLAPRGSGPNPRRARRWLAGIALLIVTLSGGAAALWHWWQERQAQLPPGIAAGNGRIEAEPVDVAAKTAGRLSAVLAEEGDMVRAGQVLARMDTREIEAARRQAEAQMRQAQRALDARRSAAAQQHTHLQLAQAEFERTRSLLQGGFATRQAMDQRTSARDGAAAALNTAVAQIGEAEQAVEAARAAIERLDAELADSLLTAPRDGRVQYKLTNAGEVLGAGGRVLTLIDVTDVSMSIFLPTEQAGRVAPGAEARIVLDALPGVVIPAHATFLSPRAQFTPKAVETRSERERLMFRVKLRIDPALLRAHAEEVRTGLPGMGYVRLDPETAWPAWLQTTKEGR
ncbi:HlyD family secretion protein [Roseomonas chloroacetimidivorans]|uniref:HlyD family secretion protein n=1 Tax=Roseomonas chloroacetimidivorans TaxID=1766656 RepID=UPI003C793331